MGLYIKKEEILLFFERQISLFSFNSIFFAIFLLMGYQFNN